MTFAQPDWLFALVLIPGFWAWASLRAQGQQTESGRGGARARWLSVDGSRVRPSPGQPAGRRYGLWASAGLALGVVALAQPQWGEGEIVRFDQGREVLIALDLSRSMLADDVPPNRLERARLLIESTLGQLRGERVGLLLFSGTAFLQSPLSADHEVLRELLPVLEPGYLPRGGTDFDAMIEAALEAFSQTGAADRYLVVLSDGESHEFDPGSIDALVEAGVQVVALGIGTEAGALIPDGRGGIVKDERGAAVLSRLERPALEALAEGTGGVYADAAQWIDLASLVERTVSTGQVGDFVEARDRARIHRFQWWLAPALLLLLASHLFEVPAAPRSRRLHERGPASRDRRSTGRAAAAGAAAVCLALATPLAGPADAAPGLSAPGAPATAPPAPGEPDPIVSIVEQLATAPEIEAVDYAALARTTVEVGFARMQSGEPLPPGAVRDGIDAVEAGRALDAEATDWAELLAALEQLAEPPPPTPSESDESGQGESGESDSSEQSGGESGESGDAQQGDESGGESQSGGDDGGDASESSGDDASGSDDGEAGESSESGSDSSGSKSETEGRQAGDPGESESAESGGAREQGDPQAMQAEEAGFGDLDEGGDAQEDAGESHGETESLAQEGEGAAQEEPQAEPQPSRMVGGTRGDNDDLMQSRPDLAAAVGRMERVREGDAPAVLFDRMNRSEGLGTDRRNDGGRDW